MNKFIFSLVYVNINKLEFDWVKHLIEPLKNNGYLRIAELVAIYYFLGGETTLVAEVEKDDLDIIEKKFKDSTMNYYYRVYEQVMEHTSIQTKLYKIVQSA